MHIKLNESFCGVCGGFSSFNSSVFCVEAGFFSVLLFVSWTWPISVVHLHKGPHKSSQVSVMCLQVINCCGLWAKLSWVHRDETGIKYTYFLFCLSLLPFLFSLDFLSILLSLFSVILFSHFLPVLLTESHRWNFLAILCYFLRVEKEKVSTSSTFQKDEWLRLKVRSASSLHHDHFLRNSQWTFRKLLLKQL